MADDTPTEDTEAQDTPPGDDTPTTAAAVGSGDPEALEDALDDLEDTDGGYVVLADAISYRTGETYRDRRGVQRTRSRRARFGQVVTIDDPDEVERLQRAGALGTADDAEAVRFLNSVQVRAGRGRERAEVLRRVAAGDSLADATLDVFGIDDVEEAADEAQAADAGVDTAGEAETRERLEAMKADEVRAEASAMGHDVNSKTTKAEAIDLIVAGPPTGE